MILMNQLIRQPSHMEKERMRQKTIINSLNTKYKQLINTCKIVKLPNNKDGQNKKD